MADALSHGYYKRDMTNRAPHKPVMECVEKALQELNQKTPAAQPANSTPTAKEGTEPRWFSNN